MYKDRSIKGINVDGVKQHNKWNQSASGVHIAEAESRNVRLFLAPKHGGEPWFEVHMYIRETSCHKCLVIQLPRPLEPHSYK